MPVATSIERWLASSSPSSSASPSARPRTVRSSVPRVASSSSSDLSRFSSLAAWGAELPLLARRPAWQLALARAALVAIPAGVAVVRQVLVFESDPYANY